MILTGLFEYLDFLTEYWPNYSVFNCTLDGIYRVNLTLSQIQPFLYFGGWLLFVLWLYRILSETGVTLMLSLAINPSILIIFD